MGFLGVSLSLLWPHNLLLTGCFRFDAILYAMVLPREDQYKQVLLLYTFIMHIIH